MKYAQLRLYLELTAHQGPVLFMCELAFKVLLMQRTTMNKCESAPRSSGLTQSTGPTRCLTACDVCTTVGCLPPITGREKCGLYGITCTFKLLLSKLPESQRVLSKGA